MIVGHNKQQEFLKKSYENQRLAHAYLFSGPEGIGKKTVALEFVALINCQDTDIEKRPCGACPSCTSFLKGIHPDIVMPEPMVLRKEIQIDEIRALIYKLSLKPFLSVYKAVIIDSAHLMNAEAQNCFLKMLEEPKGKAILILISEYPERLFPTIRSRAQEIKFYPLPFKEMKDFLLKEGIKEDEADMIMSFSLNSPGKAKEFINNPEKLKNQEQKINDFMEIVNGDLKSRFQYAESLSKKDCQEVLNIWLRWLRELMLYKTGSIKKISSSGFEDRSLLEIKKMIYELQKIIFLTVNRNINKRLALESLMLDLPTNYSPR